MADTSTIVDRLRDLAGRVSDIGVEPNLAPADAKHVRFCNIAAASVTAFALAFAVAEAPLIVDWGVSGPRDWSLLVLRFAISLPFALPLWLNAKRRHRTARLVFIYWAIAFCFGQTLYYARSAPSHVFYLSLVACALALFPRDERRAMWGSVGAAGASLLLCLWLRYRDDPWVPVQRPVIRVVSEVAVTMGAFAVALLIAMVQRVTTQRAERRVTEEQERAEQLLLNVLPASIAERLKRSPSSIADGFDEVTVMFADLVGFTPLSAKLEPAALVGLMDRVFSEFDRVAEEFGLEKIKTIGDAYMVAGGLPEPRTDHTEAVAEMALALIRIIATMPSPTGDRLDLRVGMATGAVVAGVIGRKKFSYDLWGDTVNTASRLESHGAPGRIQVSEAVWERLRDRYELEARGDIEIKGKGSMRTWFLDARKEA